MLISHGRLNPGKRGKPMLNSWKPARNMGNLHQTLETCTKHGKTYTKHGKNCTKHKETTANIRKLQQTWGTCIKHGKPASNMGNLLKHGVTPHKNYDK